MTDDYSDHPKSITEIKAFKNEAMSEWTPRDVLVATLRAIDSGELVIGADIIVIAEKQGDGNPVYIRRAGNSLKVAGLLAHAIADL